MERHDSPNSLEQRPSEHDAPHRSTKRKTDDAIIVFVAATECSWLKWLKPGFRHCFSAIRSGRHWVICDPLKDQTRLIVIDRTHDFDLARFFADQGHLVLSGAPVKHRPVPRLRLAPLTCVSVTKHVLGIRSSAIWTPWQLFCFLTDDRLHEAPWQVVPPRDDGQTKNHLTFDRK